MTSGTASLRRSITYATLVLLTVSGGLAAYFLFQPVVAQNPWNIIPVVARQITFSAPFVATSVFFIRWNNQWFQRHANEEFRLKRMELDDTDRASWFVEMAFEWKDEKDEAIPDALIERLTQGLFAEPGGERTVEPSESLIHALLGDIAAKIQRAWRL